MSGATNRQTPPQRHEAAEPTPAPYPRIELETTVVYEGFTFRVVFRDVSLGGRSRRSRGAANPWPLGGKLRFSLSCLTASVCWIAKEGGGVRYEPNINYTQLAQAVFTAYHIKATEFTFIPVGFAAVCYRMRSASQDYFLKLWLRSEQDRVGRNQRLQALRLSHALHERNVLPHIAYPLPTAAGALTTNYTDGELALFPFLNGVPLPEVWPTIIQDQWAETLIHLHQATPRLADVLPPHEQFDLTFIPPLRQSLHALVHADSDARAGFRAIRERLLAIQDEIEQQLTRLKVLQTTVRQLPSPFVLCHTDMGSDNLMLSEDGQLCILDWDEAVVAPPEHDLHEARWIAFDYLVHFYRTRGGASPLYSEQFAFYILRRALGDMTARLGRIVSTNTTEEEDADALTGIELWGIRQWRALDTTLETMKSALC